MHFSVNTFMLTQESLCSLVLFLLQMFSHFMNVLCRPTLCKIDSQFLVSYYSFDRNNKVTEMFPISYIIKQYCIMN